MGEFRALAKPMRGTQPNDPDILSAMGAAAHRESELLAPLRERHAGEAAAKAARHRRNAALLDTARPATKEERAEIKRQRAATYSADDFLDDPATPETSRPAPMQKAPAVETGEGFWSGADSTTTDSPARTQIYDASDFV